MVAQAPTTVRTIAKTIEKKLRIFSNAFFQSFIQSKRLKNALKKMNTNTHQNTTKKAAPSEGKRSPLSDIKLVQAQLNRVGVLFVAVLILHYAVYLSAVTGGIHL